jgi:hypothetical protein
MVSAAYLKAPPVGISSRLLAFYFYEGKHILMDAGSHDLSLSVTETM